MNSRKLYKLYILKMQSVFVFTFLYDRLMGFSRLLSRKWKTWSGSAEW